MGSNLVSAIEWRRDHGIWSCSIVYFDGDFKMLPLEHGSHLEFKSWMDGSAYRSILDVFFAFNQFLIDRSIQSNLATSWEFVS